LLSLLAASFFLGLLNAFLRPVLMFLALPLLIATLGLFTLVINALLLLLVSTLVGGFRVAGFWPAVKGSILISIVSLAANIMLGRTRRIPSQPKPPSRPPQAPPPDTGSGPVIDV
jgi:putative membrane protein